MELNIISFTYLFLRLAPFFLVCFFSLSSIFNQDYKGIVYLVGLLFSCFCVDSIGNLLPISYIPIENRPEICNAIKLGGINDNTKLPLSQSIFGFTYAYLLWWIIKNNFTLQNLPTLIFFPVMIIFDIIWNVNNTCYTFWQLTISLFMSAFFGTFWAFIIDSTNTPNLKYFSGMKQEEVCSVPSQQTFRCNVYKNGQLISSNIGGAPPPVAKS